MTTIVTRAGKGSPLTNAEMDQNLTNLNNAKLEGTVGVSNGGTGATTASGARTNLGTDVYKTLPLRTSGQVTGELLTTSAGQNIATGTAGDVFVIHNTSDVSSITLTAVGVTMRLAGTILTGDRTLAPRALASVTYLSATEVLVAGAGVS